MNRYLVPLVVFVCLVALFQFGLNHDPRLVPSPLIDKPAPAFDLPDVKDTAITVKSSDLQGQPVLLNVWASWCVECRKEHSVLMELSRQGRVRIYGLNYKDSREQALQWLDRHGDPYVRSAHDLNGRVGLDFGVYGVPETFVLDRNGIIRYKHIGAITPQVRDEIILPLLNKLEHPQT